MKETTVKPIGAVRATETTMSGKIENLSARERSVQNTERAVKRTAPEKEDSQHLSNIAIHFNVDEESNRLVVVVTDRESGRLLRTIPASEFQKMQAGDLLKLKA